MRHFIIMKLNMLRRRIFSTQENPEHNEMTVECFLVQKGLSELVLVVLTGQLEDWPHADRVLFVIFQVEVFIWVGSSVNRFLKSLVC